MTADLLQLVKLFGLGERLGAGNAVARRVGGARAIERGVGWRCMVAAALSTADGPAAVAASSLASILACIRSIASEQGLA